MKHVHGGDIYDTDIYDNEVELDFSANINPLGPTEYMIESMTKCLPEVGRYPDVKCRRLRTKLAEKESVPIEYITCGNGAADIIFSLVLACRPKKALLAAPTFAEYEQALLTVDCKVDYYKLKEAESFQLTEEYLSCLTRDLDIIFLCSPNNPIGNTVPKELLIRIMNICEEKKILFVLDECFVDFLKVPSSQSMAGYLETHPHLFILKAFTKMHAIPGVRLGYGLSGNVSFVKRLEHMRQPWNVSLIAQEAGLAAIQEYGLEEKTRHYIEKERLYMCQELTRIGVQFYQPEANYIFLKSDYDLFELLRQKGILIRDCSNYQGLSKGYYRVAVKLAEQNRWLLQELEAIYQRGGAKDGEINHDSGNHVKCR